MWTRQALALRVLLRVAVSQPILVSDGLRQRRRQPLHRMIHFPRWV